MMAATAAPHGGWALVVPLKPLPLAKSRLAPAAGPHRAELALAFARDAVSAALRCPPVRLVVVVTDDTRASGVLRADSGARLTVVADEPGAGLNAALRHGAEAVRRLRPGLGVAAMSADLPALRTEELGLVLAAAAGVRRAFLRDADGVGTTLLAAAAGTPLAPAFGGASAARHGASGAAELTVRGVDSVRRDVDTGDNLAAAVRLGVGRWTSAALARVAEGAGG